MLSSVLQTVCQSLSDANHVVRGAALFALGQFSKHLQVTFDTVIFDPRPISVLKHSK